MVILGYYALIGLFFGMWLCYMAVEKLGWDWIVDSLRQENKSLWKGVSDETLKYFLTAAILGVSCVMWPVLVYKMIG